MAKKKSFRSNTAMPGGLGSIIRNTSNPPAPPPTERKQHTPPGEAQPAPATVPRKRRKTARPKVSSSERGCKDGDTRKTFIVRKELVEKMMDIAYWEPGKMKDHVNAALEAYVKKKWSKKRPSDS
jgi:hypothetical protein